MNFEDIPQFTSRSNYTTQIELPDLLHALKSLDDFISDDKGNVTTTKGLILNPDFQRGLVWNVEQQISFVEYLLKGGLSGREIYLNNPPHLSSYSEPYTCVDGLQRLTACIKFVKNELKVFGSYMTDFEGHIPHSVYLNVHINDLKTRKDVLNWYLEMNIEGTPHTLEELNRVRDLLNNENN